MFIQVIKLWQGKVCIQLRNFHIRMNNNWVAQLLLICSPEMIKTFLLICFPGVILINDDKILLSLFIAFSCNTKRFTIVFLFFSPLSLSCQSFWTDRQKIFRERFKISYQGLTHSLYTPKNVSVKIVSQLVIRYASDT